MFEIVTEVIKCVENQFLFGVSPGEVYHCKYFTILSITHNCVIIDINHSSVVISVSYEFQKTF